MALAAELRADAQRILDASGHPYKQVVAIDYDSILYVDAFGRPRTLWLSRQGGSGRLRTRMVTGFQIEPPDDFRQVLAQA